MARSAPIRQFLDPASAVRPRGQVYVLAERCKECRFCVEFCPEDVLVESSDTNAKGYRYPVVAAGKEYGCVNCGFCEIVCPEFAIYTVEVN